LIIIEASIAVRITAKKTHFRFLSHKSLLKNEDRKTSRGSRRSSQWNSCEVVKVDQAARLHSDYATELSNDRTMFTTQHILLKNGNICNIE
jgi:hypothetical protein